MLGGRGAGLTNSSFIFHVSVTLGCGPGEHHLLPIPCNSPPVWAEPWARAHHNPMLLPGTLAPTPTPPHPIGKSLRGLIPGDKPHINACYSQTSVPIFIPLPGKTNQLPPPSLSSPFPAPTSGAVTQGSEFGQLRCAVRLHAPGSDLFRANECGEP